MYLNSPTKSQWWMRRFSSSGLFRRLYRTVRTLIRLAMWAAVPGWWCECRPRLPPPEERGVGGGCCCCTCCTCCCCCGCCCCWMALAGVRVVRVVVAVVQLLPVTAPPKSCSVGGGLSKPIT